MCVYALIIGVKLPVSPANPLICDLLKRVCAHVHTHTQLRHAGLPFCLPGKSAGKYVLQMADGTAL